MANEYFSGAMEKLLAGEGSVFKGPFVPLGFTPFLHQEQAFAWLQSSVCASTTISTGIGSGKTERILLPILDYCSSCGGSSSGIKAIIIPTINVLAVE